MRRAFCSASGFVRRLSVRFVMQDAEVPQLLAALVAQTAAVSASQFRDNGSLVLRRSVMDVDEDGSRDYEYTLAKAGGSWRISDCPNELPPGTSQTLRKGDARVRFVNVKPREGKGKERLSLEWWVSGGLACRADLSGLHGKVRLTGELGGYDWSSDGTKLVYVAEDKEPEYKGYFDPKPAKAGDEKEKEKGKEEGEGESGLLGGGNEYKDDWGELLQKTHRLAIFVAELSPSGAVKVTKLEGVDKDSTPAEPAWYGPGVVYTAHLRDEFFRRRLGLVYCCNRRSELRMAVHPPAEPAAEHALLTEGWVAARSARVHASGSLVFLGLTERVVTHSVAFDIGLIGEVGAKPRVLLPRVIDPPDDAAFPGVYDNMLPLQCWVPDGQSVHVNCQRGGRGEVWRISVAQPGPPVRVLAAGADCDSTAHLSAAASLTLLAISPQAMLLQESHPASPPALVICEDGERPQRLRLPPVTVVTSPPGTDVTPTNVGVRASKIFEATGAALPKVVSGHAFLLEPIGDGPLKGIILYPHGGPHGATPYGFTATGPFLARTTDCAIVYANYRGGIGCGQRAMDSLTGNVGTMDVSDCMAALEAAEQHLTRPVAKDAEGKPVAGVTGGSHGGFLTAHLSSQFPSRFRAAALRNPVINLPSMMTATDIPDWVRIESMGAAHPACAKEHFADTALTPDLLAAMLKASPVIRAADVRAATMVMLGDEDKRVPPSQGREWYHLIRRQLGDDKAKLLVYPQDSHPLSGTVTLMEHTVKLAMWFRKHM
eukprot:TRINITY_DN29916_c0_g1_i1.p1 TRINITY_DN29916_c0_g1~~TRINITY_DN29916_c0_g1_i1.p1  ORF type:complete len:770 (+),score=258.00 TRINITY_DN29916_c0_g1_i1:44-2353(+)